MLKDQAKIQPQAKITEAKVGKIGKKVLGLAEALRRRLSKKKWSDGIDILQLSGDEWLRLLSGETNLAALAGWCQTCRTGRCHGDVCKQCRAALLKFDDHFWAHIDRKIRRAMQKDKSLLSRVKSERESLYGSKHTPTFPSGLGWLLKAWEQAPRPPHQPFNPKVHYYVANWIESLRTLGLSQAEIIDVLTGEEFPNGPFTCQGKDYATIPGEELRKLGEAFRRGLGGVPCSAQDLSEMWRTTTWVDRQRAVPLARLRGEPVRRRNPAEGG
jgi:hypothetical protein